MGIDGFKKFMLETYPKAWTGVKKFGRLPFNQHCDRLYIDCNDLLHQAARRANDEPGLFVELFRSLDSIMHLCHPALSVVLALDGPGPYAKVLEQRRRRADTGRKMKQSQKKRAGGRGNSQTRKAELKQSLTPGTSLMQRLQSALLYWAECKLTYTNPAILKGVSFFITGSDIPGEGEV